MVSSMKARSLAQDATTWYLKKIDPFTPHATNVQTLLRIHVLHLTLKVLAPELQTAKEQEWGKWDQQAYDSLGRRNKARMDAFLQGCVLAVPGDPSPSERRDTKANNNTKTPTKNNGNRHQQSSPMMTSIQNVAMMRHSSTTAMEYPQFSASELTVRLELYLLSLVVSPDDTTSTTMTNTNNKKVSRARAMCIVRAFVWTAGCVRSVGPTLTQLLVAMTKEVLCVEQLCGQVTTVIRRVVSEYVHQVSFASLAFLSSPEDSAEQRLAPMVLAYLDYLKENKEGIVQDCETECLLTKILDPKMRHFFKTVEFRSIGHLLEVCQDFHYELQNIEIPPPVDKATRLGCKNPCDDTIVLKQAIRDLQREVLTVNGHVLPPVNNRKELLQLLSQTLNSRSLFRRKNRYDRRVKSKASLTKQSEPEGPFSSGNEGDFDFSSGTEGQSVGEEIRIQKQQVRNQRQTFQLSTVDIMTRRLLVASSRTGMGGDAYFIVRDLFGGDDVEVVPSREQVVVAHGGRPRSGSIEIVVRLSSVTIKCHASFDVYPKSSVGDCEPLIQLHTTTAETINLQEVRASDSDGGGLNIADDESEDDDDRSSKLILQEKRTDKTGWRTISIRPALYEAVGEWNTPS